ncbi:hypothetical protein IE81DRAFT_3255 [Ceraceosorus guamensis]|uniref:Uncharacterized protein n=1 Tax=Ceraceosorus guamensis TaxID=1522189 RepID=A0A316WEY6_9BASI|nr:hypothetical protein IE81DRAFT_3255 [Ceraceosorus guamensis]PWN46293.1 hypothetical protein IE81DRAFT_3255 [Ceraceosorus guamensis]
MLWRREANASAFTLCAAALSLLVECTANSMGSAHATHLARSETYALRKRGMPGWRPNSLPFSHQPFGHVQGSNPSALREEAGHLASFEAPPSNFVQRLHSTSTTDPHGHATARHLVELARTRHNPFRAMLDLPASVHLPNDAPHLQEHNFLPPQGSQPSRPQAEIPLRHQEGKSSHPQEGLPPRPQKRLKTTVGSSSMPLRKGQHDENNVTDENGLEINWRGRDPKDAWNKDIRTALEWHRDTHMPDMRAFTVYRSWKEGRAKEPLPHFQGLAPTEIAFAFQRMERPVVVKSLNRKDTT